MGLAISQDVALGPGVAEFIERHAFQSAFRTACEVVEECYPAAQALRTYLLDDPDEDGRVWLVIEVKLAADHPVEEAVRAHRHCTDILVQRIPLESQPLLAVVEEFAEE